MKVVTINHCAMKSWTDHACIALVGWTRWLESVLLGIVNSPAERGLRFIIGRKSLKEALQRYQTNTRYRRLVIDFEFGEDPDGA